MDIELILKHHAPKDITLKRLTGKSRKLELIKWRAALYHILRREGWSLQKIGDEFNRNHATVINGMREIRNFPDMEEVVRMVQGNEYQFSYENFGIMNQEINDYYYEKFAQLEEKVLRYILQQILNREPEADDFKDLEKYQPDYDQTKCYISYKGLKVGTINRVFESPYSISFEPFTEGFLEPAVENNKVTI